MPIIKWEPFSEIDRLLENRPFLPIAKLGWDLAADVYEEKGAVVAKMTLPGIDPKDLEISAEEDALTVSGRREEERETKNKDYYSKEIRRGSFSRSVMLPKSIDPSRAMAEYKNGVLVVTMPITGGAKDKSVKIRVKASS